LGRQEGRDLDQQQLVLSAVRDGSRRFTVLYVGYERLWRTANSGDAWTAITGPLVGAGTNITAIAVAPSDSNTIYVGMQNGRVFRVALSGGTWTATDVTSAPLPAGQISDIAIHPTNASIVYVTTSNLIFSEGAGEFTNDHVFRTIDGGTTWVNRSAGLAQANPVNAIAIDPANPDTIYIGCDVGIVRSTNGGGAWAAWDEGLPNCSVQDLKFFAPRRLLRAATHGRSIWGRPVDAAAIPLTDIYMRDDVLDTGLATPGPSGVDHPFNAGETVYWYQSPDIKIDAPDPATSAYQTPSRDIDYVQFEELVHDNPRRDTWVRVYAQVHNRGNDPATNVHLRAFWANAGAGLPNLPADFWTAFPNTDPSDTSVWHPVGASRILDVIYPGQPRVASWSWLVPGSAPTHSCMLAVAKSDEDAVTTSSLAIATAVNGDNNVTLKNLHVDNVVPGRDRRGRRCGPLFHRLRRLQSEGDARRAYQCRDVAARHARAGLLFRVQDAVPHREIGGGPVRPCQEARDTARAAGAGKAKKVGRGRHRADFGSGQIGERAAGAGGGQVLRDLRCGAGEGLPHAARSSPAAGLLGTRAEWLHGEEATLAEAEWGRRFEAPEFAACGPRGTTGELESLRRCSCGPRFRHRGGRDELIDRVREQVQDGADGAQKWRAAGDPSHRWPVAAMGLLATQRAAGSLPRHWRGPREPRSDPDRDGRRVFGPACDPWNLLVRDTAVDRTDRSHPLGGAPSPDEPVDHRGSGDQRDQRPRVATLRDPAAV